MGFLDDLMKLWMVVSAVIIGLAPLGIAYFYLNHIDRPGWALALLVSSLFWYIAPLSIALSRLFQ